MKTIVPSLLVTVLLLQADARSQSVFDSDFANTDISASDPPVSSSKPLEVLAKENLLTFDLGFISTSLIGTEYSSSLSLDAIEDFVHWRSRNAFQEYLESVNEGFLKDLTEPGLSSLVVVQWKSLDRVFVETQSIVPGAELRDGPAGNRHELVWTPEGFKLNGYLVRERIGCRLGPSYRRIVESIPLTTESSESELVLRSRDGKVMVVLSDDKPQQDLKAQPEGLPSNVGIAEIASLIDSRLGNERMSLGTLQQYVSVKDSSELFRMGDAVDFEDLSKRRCARW